MLVTRYYLNTIGEGQICNKYARSHCKRALAKYVLFLLRDIIQVTIVYLYVVLDKYRYWQRSIWSSIVNN